MNRLLIFLLSLCIPSLHAISNNKEKHKPPIETNCTVFQLLESCGVPVTSQNKVDDIIPYNIVIRREAHGLYLKRHPHLQKGHLFPHLVTEFFLNTEKKWDGEKLAYPNPLVMHQNRTALLYRTDRALFDQKPFASLSEYPLKNKEFYLYEMRQIAQRAFLVLEKAWQLTGSTLVELTVQFGFDTNENLCLANIIAYNSDSDHNGSSAMGTQHMFTKNKQQLILWLSAEKLDTASFIEKIKPYLSDDIKLVTINCPVHLDPITSYQSLQKQTQETPDSVMVVCEENGTHSSALLSAQTIVPVISVATPGNNPPSKKQNLNSPQEAPVMVINNLENAQLAALQLLARCNPRLYAQLQMERMDRMRNIISLSS